MRLPKPDYFAVLATKRRTVNVALADGNELAVRRARLRLYAELENIQSGEGEADEKAMAYIEAATERPIEDFDPAEFLATYALLLDLNQSRSVPAILRTKGSGRAPNAFRYEGRWLVALVEELVEAGWDAHYVLEEMDFDEAWLYVQEAQYSEWGRYQQQYALSAVGRDKRGKQAKMQPPGWTFVGYAEPRPRGYKKPLPPGISGIVVDLNDPDDVAALQQRAVA